MFLPFFERLRTVGVPVSLREYLSFLEGLAAGLATYDVEAFYYLGRTAMVKDERHLDRFDRADGAEPNEWGCNWFVSPIRRSATACKPTPLSKRSRT